MNTLHFTLVTYDVPSDRRRRRIARIADDFGCRVQRSVFYGWLAPPQRRRLIAALRSACDPAEDSILVLATCDRCLADLRPIGTASIQTLPICWIF